MILDTLTAWCGSVPAAGGTVAGLFLAGLIGGPMHCGAMCGGFVLGQVADRMADIPVARFSVWQRIGAGALLPYHLGRLTTYALLGAVAAGGTLVLLPRWSTSVLLLFAAALFLCRAVGVHWGSVKVPGMRRGVSWLAARARGNAFGLGVALGFLPCGLLYTAVAVAAASRDPATGAVGMLAFGLGTAPTLLVVGIAGQLAGQRWRRRVAVWSPALLAVNAALLIVLAILGWPPAGQAL